MKLTEKDKSILIGLLLGDGYIDDKGRICIEHGEKQKDYCIYKAKLLHSVCGGKDIKVHEYIALWWMDDGCLTKKYTYRMEKKIIVDIC